MRFVRIYISYYVSSEFSYNNISHLGLIVIESKCHFIFSFILFPCMIYSCYVRIFIFFKLSLLIFTLWFIVHNSLSLYK
jgi:hypothetical protein